MPVTYRVLLHLLWLLQCGMLGTWGSLGAYIAGQLPTVLDPSASDRHIWQICAYVAAALTGILLIFTLVLIRRIKVCLGRKIDACAGAHIIEGHPYALPQWDGELTA